MVAHHVGPRSARVVEDRRDVVQRQTRVLGPSDETEPADRIRGEPSFPTDPIGRGDDAAFVVIPNGRHAGARGICESTDGE